MADNGQPFSNTFHHQNFSSRLISSGTSQSSSIDTGSGMSPGELSRQDLNDDQSWHRQNNTNGSLRRICFKYEIQPQIAERLRKLRDFEIVIVCDDSGSMVSTVDRTQRTRWDELRSIVKIIVDVGVLFDSNGVDIYFLNRESFLRVKDPKVVDQAFEILPSGYTPLAPVLNKIFESQLAHRGRDKKLLVFVVTDGEPTDKDDNINIGELEYVMREKRQADTTYVSFLVCTDVPACVNYLREWDQAMPNVDVTDDFNSEREIIRQYRGDNYHFSYGDYIIKALLGAIDPEIDSLNDP